MAAKGSVIKEARMFLLFVSYLDVKPTEIFCSHTFYDTMFNI